MHTTYGLQTSNQPDNNNAHHVRTVVLSLDHSGEEAEAELDLLGPREHLVVQEDGQHAVERGREEACVFVCLKGGKEGGG
jgi:hypothetical protein